MNTKREQFLEAAGIRVRFSWRGDRWVHEMLLPQGARWVPVLASVEGSPQDLWPVSPPLQSLEIERRAGGQSIALLVGMAGHSHWSASAQIDPELPGVHFDVACRLRETESGPLGSTYQTNADGFPDDSIRIEVDDRFAPLRLERKAGSARIAVRPSADAAARTIRWAYRLIAHDERCDDQKSDRV